MPASPRIVVLDGQTANPGDLDWKPIERLGATTVYARSAPAEVLERARGAQIVLANKALLSAATIAQLPDLRLICVTATGYNNVDVAAANERGITVVNLPGYSTDSVTQHTFAMLFALTNQTVALYNSVKTGGWERSKDFSYTIGSIPELCGKTMGLLGYGAIAKAVAKVADAFGMHVITHRRRPNKHRDKTARLVSFDDLLLESDVLSLHAPLNEDTRDLFNYSNLKKMRPHAILLNTGRGELIVEEDLARALDEGCLMGAAVDVLRREPPSEGNVLIDHPRCLVTPHVAWASDQARRRLIRWTADNIMAWKAGTPQNVVSA